MKKFILAVMSIVLILSVVACGGKKEEKAKLKVGMVTDAGTIDDKSFNQGTWEGVLRAQDTLGIDARYLKPAGTTEADYITEIGNLVDANYKFVITPGFKFETAIFKAQSKHTDAKFVLIDGMPHAGDWNPVVKENTVSIFFAEHEAGFLAGLATALQLKDANIGFIGGMEIPPVQKFNWGFQQGIAYANEKLGTKCVIDPQNFVYQGTFNEVQAGAQLAATMFDRGVNAIFACAGGVGIGAINEAKSRAQVGENVWIIGVDVDQYASGEYEKGKSIILTSAMKRIDNAAYDMVKAELEGKFPGGQMLTFDIKNDGVGIPAKNPNLSDDVMKKVLEVQELMKKGTVKVSGERGNLIK